MRSVKVKIALSMFLLSMMAMGVVLLTVYSASLTSLRNKEIQYNVEAASQTKYTLSYLFDSVYKTARLLIANSDISNALYMEEQTDPQELAEIQSGLSQTLQTLIYPMEIIEALHVVGGQDWQFFTTAPMVNEAQIRAICQSVEARDLSRNPYSFTDVVQMEYAPGVRKNVVHYISPINRLANMGRLGYIVVDIDCVLLEQMFLFTSYQSDDKAMVAQPDGNILFNYPKTTAMDSVLRDYPQLLTQREAIIEGSVFGAPTMIISDTVDYTGWRIIHLVPLSSITRDTRSIMELMFRIGASFFLVSLALSFMIAGALTRPVTALARAFQQAENGDMDVRVKIRTRDEMGKLGNAFNSMMYKLNDFFNRELEMQKKRSDMELEVLESQINPHFLYNTLDSIRWLAVLQNVDNIARMTAALISLLRYNLSNASHVVPLRKEIESVEAYTLLQQYRYGTQLELATRLQPETLDLEMPRFILQPLVENCIIHAYGQMEQIGGILIESELGKDELMIRVIDQGCGMAEGADLNAHPEEKGSRFKNIGIANIRERIRLYYGERYGLRYRKGEGGGTVAEVNLPVIRGQG